MGNINDVWYLKSAGGSWADTKCSLDDCYSIPYDDLADDNLYLQVDIPIENAVIEKIWLADLNGSRIENIMAITDWKIITGNGMYRLIFRVHTTKACRAYMSGKVLDCFRFEVPLMSGGSPSVEIDTLISEPFHCPKCEETVKISSDYCFAPMDIFNSFIFHTNGMGTAQYGGLNEAKNDFRIQAKLKQMPSQVKATRNLRCFNYNSTLQQRFRLQGAMTDFPDYMVNIIESIFSGKYLYIDGEEYVITGDKLFTERKVAGRSMKQLDVELKKCELKAIHKCMCVVNCEEHPVSFPPSAVTLKLAAELGYTLDNTYWYAEIDESQVTGEPPFIYHWSVPTGNAAPNSDLVPFIDNRYYNIFRRTNINEGTMHIQVSVTDSNGCSAENGNIKVVPLICQGFDGGFTVGTTTPTSIEIAGVSPALGFGDNIDISVDGGMSYAATGVIPPYTVTGLAPGPHVIVIRYNCFVHPGAFTHGSIGPMEITI
jgi:hypothetical protein